MKQIKQSLIFVVLLFVFAQYTVPTAKAQTGTPQEECPGDRKARGLTFSPDSKYVLASWNKGTARLWEVSTGKVIHTFQHGSHWINDVNFSPDGKHIVTAQGKEAILWDMETGAKIRTFTDDQNQDEVDMIAKFLPDNKHLLTSTDSNVVLWELETGKRIYTLPAGFHRNGGVELQLSLNGKYILLRRQSRKLEESGWQLRNALTGEMLHLFKGENAKFSPDSKRILTVDYRNVDDKGLILWDIATKDKIHNLTTTSSIGWKLFSPNSKYIFLLIPDENEDIGRVLDTTTLQKALEISFESAFIQAAFTQDNSYFIVIQHREGKDIFTKWDTHSWKQIVSHPTAIDSGTYDFLLSPDGNYILTNGVYTSDENLHLDLWDSQGIMKIHSFC